MSSPDAGTVSGGKAPESLGDEIVQTIYNRAEEVASRVVQRQAGGRRRWEDRIDDVVTSRLLGFPIMVLLLGLVLWLTIAGANYPSQALATGLFWLEGRLSELFLLLGAPAWLHGIVVHGIYRSLAWVVSVMLPPMAIFFPCFTLLEDLGYLPRVAFNLDRAFQWAGAHGRQALTMCMGFGCNAAGVISCRIINSPRERLIACLTNVFVPCNGRFPLMIALAALFWGPGIGGSAATGAGAAGVVLGIIVLGVAATLAVSWALSRTLLRGAPSHYTLELPPYRPPRVGQILVRSLLDRTLFVLFRAVVVAAPAGALTWILANVSLGEASLLAQTAGALDGLARTVGLDGFILMAFILGLPANEIVLPIILMGYLSTGAMAEMEGLGTLRSVLVDGRGWTSLTALCVMLFSLLHFPCGTTLLTIWKETRSLKWTAAATAIPLALALIACLIVAQTARLL